YDLELNNRIGKRICTWKWTIEPVRGIDLWNWLGELSNGIGCSECMS
ncbi:hypothetical protein LINPERHAP1_LOCUS15692, partial [Linum perenne]